MKRCKSVVSDAKQCKRNSLPGSRYCWQHTPRWTRGSVVAGVAVILGVIGHLANLVDLGLPWPPSTGDTEISAPRPTIFVKVVNETGAPIVVEPFVDYIPTESRGARIHEYENGRLQLLTTSYGDDLELAAADSGVFRAELNDVLANSSLLARGAGQLNIRLHVAGRSDVLLEAIPTMREVMESYPLVFRIQPEEGVESLDP